MLMHLFQYMASLTYFFKISTMNEYISLQRINTSYNRYRKSRTFFFSEGIKTFGLANSISIKNLLLTDIQSVLFVTKRRQTKKLAYCVTSQHVIFLLFRQLLLFSVGIKFNQIIYEIFQRFSSYIFKKIALTVQTKEI